MIQPAILPATAQLLLAIDPQAEIGGNFAVESPFSALLDAEIGAGLAGKASELAAAPVSGAGRSERQAAPEPAVASKPIGKILPDRLQFAVKAALPAIAQALSPARPAADDAADSDPDGPETELAAVSAQELPSPPMLAAVLPFTISVALPQALSAPVKSSEAPPAPATDKTPPTATPPVVLAPVQKLLARLSAALPRLQTAIDAAPELPVAADPQAPAPASSPPPGQLPMRAALPPALTARSLALPVPLPRSAAFERIPVVAAEMANPAQLPAAPLVLEHQAVLELQPEPKRQSAPELKPPLRLEPLPQLQSTLSLQLSPLLLSTLLPHPARAQKAPVAAGNEAAGTTITAAKPMSVLSDDPASALDPSPPNPSIQQAASPLAAEQSAAAATPPPAIGPATSTTASTTASTNAAPHDFAALIDRLVEARQAAQTSLTSQVVNAAVTHSEFGRVSLQFRQDAEGLSVAMASADPDLARAVQIAAAAAQTGAQTGPQTGNSEGNASPRQDSNAQQFAGGGQTQSQAQAQAQAQSQQQRGQSSQRLADETRAAANPSPNQRGQSNPSARGGIFA